MSRKKRNDEAYPKKGAVVNVATQKPVRLSVLRLVTVCLVAAIMLAFLVTALITVFSPEKQEHYGHLFAKAARAMDSTFPESLDAVYGKALCYGYFGVVAIGFLPISCLLRYHRRKLSKLFFWLFIVASLVADGLYLYFTRGMVKTIVADGSFSTDGVYKLLGFIPIPNLFAIYFLMFSRCYLYVVLPAIAQALMLTAYFGLRRFKPRLYEILNLVAFLILICFTAILVSYVLLTVIAVVLIVALLWMLKGFFTVDTGRFVTTSDGTSLYQVDGDLYSDGNGNYYTYDGDSFR